VPGGLGTGEKYRRSYFELRLEAARGEPMHPQNQGFLRKGHEVFAGRTRRGKSLTRVLNPLARKLNSAFVSSASATGSLNEFYKAQKAQGVMP
jgi:hypothetical protein